METNYGTKERREQQERQQRFEQNQFNRFASLEKEIGAIDLVRKHAADPKKELLAPPDTWQQGLPVSRISGEDLPERIMQRRDLRGLLPSTLQQQAPSFRQEVFLRMNATEKLLVSEQGELLATKAKVLEVMNEHAERIVTKQHVDRQIKEWSENSLLRARNELDEVPVWEQRLAEIEVEAPMEATVNDVIQGSIDLRDRAKKVEVVGENLSDALHAYMLMAGVSSQGKKSVGTTTTHIFTTSSIRKAETNHLIPPECIVLPNNTFSEAIEAQKKRAAARGMKGQAEHEKQQLAMMEARLQSKDRLVLKTMHEKELVMTMFKAKLAALRAKLHVRDDQIRVIRQVNESMMTGDGFTSFWEKKEESEKNYGENLIKGDGMTRMVENIRNEFQEQLTRERKKVGDLQSEVNRLVSMHYEDIEDADAQFKDLLEKVDSLTCQIHLLQHELIIKDDIIYEKNHQIRSLMGESHSAVIQSDRHEAERLELRYRVSQLTVEIEAQRKKMASMITITEHKAKLEDSVKEFREFMNDRSSESRTLKREIEAMRKAAEAEAEANHAKEKQLQEDFKDVKKETAILRLRMEAIVGRLEEILMKMLNSFSELQQKLLSPLKDVRYMSWDIMQTLMFSIQRDLNGTAIKDWMTRPRDVINDLLDVPWKAPECEESAETMKAVKESNAIAAAQNELLSSQNKLLREMVQKFFLKLSSLLQCASLADIAQVPEREVEWKLEGEDQKMQEAESETWDQLVQAWSDTREKLAHVFHQNQEDSGRVDLLQGTSHDLQTKLGCMHQSMNDLIELQTECMQQQRRFLDMAFHVTDPTLTEVMTPLLLSDRKCLEGVVAWRLANARSRLCQGCRAARQLQELNSHRAQYYLDREAATANKEHGKLVGLDCAWEIKKNRMLGHLQQGELIYAQKNSERILAFIDLQKQRIIALSKLADAAKYQLVSPLQLENLKQDCERQKQILQDQLDEALYRPEKATVSIQTMRMKSMDQAIMTDTPENSKVKFIIASQDSEDRETQTETVHTGKGLPEPAVFVDHKANNALLAKKLRDVQAELERTVFESKNSNILLEEAKASIRQVLQAMDRQSSSLVVIRRKELEDYDRMSMETLKRAICVKFEDIMRASALKLAQQEDEIESLRKERQTMTYEKASIYETTRDLEVRNQKAQAHQTQLQVQLMNMNRELEEARRWTGNFSKISESVDPDLERPFARRLPDKAPNQTIGTQTDRVEFQDDQDYVPQGKTIPVGPEPSVDLNAPRRQLYRECENYLDRVKTSVRNRDGMMTRNDGPSRPSTASVPPHVCVQNIPTVVSGYDSYDQPVVVYSPRRHVTDVGTASTERTQRLSMVLELHRNRPCTALSSSAEVITPGPAPLYPGGDLSRPIQKVRSQSASLVHGRNPPLTPQVPELIVKELKPQEALRPPTAAAKEEAKKSRYRALPRVASPLLGKIPKNNLSILLPKAKDDTERQKKL